MPILLNTSFNESEPIVMSPEHALETFAKTRIDLLVLGNYIMRSLEPAGIKTDDSVVAAHPGSRSPGYPAM